MLISDHIKKSSFGFVIFSDLCFFLFTIPCSRFPIPVPLLGGVRGGFRFPIPDSQFPNLK
ncbi:MAG: hypothetical protein F6K63_31690 [Moorea sp. SIO1G6]|uniref:hypothetical protein n=1 Tax=Moorena sp. SIO1G6 TaxID=2607840 RepID=UPI0013C0C6DA|nr:hypothetical protein [Moorena sp. SIO1G6]NET68711.1 hypothetical protein [Moorena sp. SIO1G6]